MIRSMLAVAAVSTVMAGLVLPAFAAQELPPVDADEQREIAREILEEIGYTFDEPSSSGAPEQTPASDSGETQVQPLESANVPPPQPSADGFSLGPFNNPVISIVALTALGAVAAYVIWMLVRRRVSAVQSSHKKSATTKMTATRPEPLTLEQVADEAARAGDFERAIRLRFQAGLLRLEKQGVLAYHETLTTGDVSDVLHNPRFSVIATSFDAVAYGNRPAGLDEYQSAADTWPIVLQEAERP